jgi:hypothetical protein
MGLSLPAGTISMPTIPNLIVTGFVTSSPFDGVIKNNRLFLSEYDSV